MIKQYYYFAFGSNMDTAQMQRRCPSAEVVAKATLPDHRFAFAGYSHGWGGAVATVIPCPRATVPGIVYRLTAEDLGRLDQFEGAPFVYGRSAQCVRLEGGRLRKALVYMHLNPGARPAAPSAAYMQAIRGACARFGISFTHVANAMEDTMQSISDYIENNPPAQGPDRVFVYGSLKHGLSNHRLLEKAVYAGEGTLEGYRMYSLGAFPAIVEGTPLGQESRWTVEGEVYEVSAEILAALDRLEGHPSFYRRHRVLLQGGERVWVYTLRNDQVRGRALIPSGVWSAPRHDEHAYYAAPPPPSAEPISRAKAKSWIELDESDFAPRFRVPVSVRLPLPPK
jgi:gamma-glutamylcyclotransferase (GGCT)/AIG2-like uncharacterized protein YtfP